MALSIILSFIFGSIVGSFLNVVIFRLHAGRSFVGGRSACLSCKKELGALDLIPVISFMFLRGKCRYCNARLSWQYPVVELAAGLAFALAAFVFGDRWDFFAYAIVLSCFFIVVAVYDFRHQLILDKVILPAGILALVGNLVIDFSGGCPVWWQCRTVSGLFGAGLISGFFLLQYLVSRGKWIGFGDVKYGLVLGQVAGFPGGLILLFLAYSAGAIIGLVLIAAGRKQLSSKLPFGTFLSFSAIMTLLFGPAVLDWYLKLIGL